MNTDVTAYLQCIKLPSPSSHKGQNGKLLVIGGSSLFHAASKWSLDVASQFVDMVFYASVPSNNDLVQAAKQDFWNGIVIPREEIEHYIDEADCVLIGPGMTRSDFSFDIPTHLSQEEWNDSTHKVVNFLLNKYPHKKWVLDAGALQMVNPSLLTDRCIVTPHPGELRILVEHTQKVGSRAETKTEPSSAQEVKPFLSRSEEEVAALLQSSEFQQLRSKGTVFLLKGPSDTILQRDTALSVAGGNAGMTKGGTGDVLAGLVAALFCTQEALTAAAVGSYVNKKAGEKLYTEVGPYYNASDLVASVPKVMWAELQKLN